MNARSVFYIVIAMVNLVRGTAITTLSWVAMYITGELSAVGGVFAINHAVGLILGPLIGVVIDRNDRRALLIWGLLVYAIAMAVPAGLLFQEQRLPFAIILISTAGAAVGLIVMSGSIDALQQIVFNSDEQRVVSANVGTIRQAALIAGTGSAGIIIYYVGNWGGFIAVVLLCTSGAAISGCLPAAGITKSDTGSVWKQFSEGLTVLRLKNEIGIFIILTALVFSVGQASNALLSGLIKNELGGNSALFGAVDAAWSVGGIAGALVIGRLMRKNKCAGFEFVCAIGLGSLAMLFGTLDRPIYLMATFAGMGFLFSVTKVICDGRILEQCPNDVIGRVRGVTQGTISLVGIVVYLTPAIFSVSNARVMYLWNGMAVFVVAVCAAILYLYQKLNVQGALRS